MTNLIKIDYYTKLYKASYFILLMLFSKVDVNVINFCYEEY